jgi:glycosyltransferase involved in cell wall biosynthesis
VSGTRAPRRRVVVDLHVADRAGMEHTGVGRYAIESTRALCAARPSWDVIVLTARPGLVPEPNARHVESRLPIERPWARAAWLHGLSWAQTFRARDAVWVATAFTLPLWRRGPSIVTIHDLVPLEHRETYSGAISARYASAATRWSARHADAVICGSPYTAQRIVARLGARPERVHVVPYGVAAAFRDVPRREADPPFALFVGTFEPRKGLDTLAEAARRLGADVPIVLAGKPGWGKMEIQCTNGVRVIEAPDDAALRELYATAAVLVLPSRAEGFGLPVAEAMAAGLPVICSDLPAITGFAGDAPRYVPVGDAEALATTLREVLGDAELRQRMAARGRAQAQGLRWERVGELLAAQIDAVSR